MSIKLFKSSILFLSAFYVLFFIFDIWFDVVSAEVFFKVTLTFGAIIGFLCVYYLLMHAETDKDLEKKGYMSE